MSDVIPRYYMTHETPAGVRHAYRLPLLGTSWNERDATWTSPDANSEAVTVSRDRYDRDTSGWLITDRPVNTIIGTVRKQVGPGPWTKTAERPADPMAAMSWDTWPDTPDASLAEHWDAETSDYKRLEGGCTTCTTFRAVYGRTPVYENVNTVIDVSDWLPLTGAPDAHPDREWLIDPSLTALYGPAVNHMWPGEMTGFRAAVNEALKADRRTKYVFTHHQQGAPYGSTEVYVPILWDVPKSRTETRGSNGRRLRKPYQVPVPVAQDHKITLTIPENHAAATKAAAATTWDAAVAEWVERFMPPPVRACSACDGHGYVPDEGSA